MATDSLIEKLEAMTDLNEKALAEVCKRYNGNYLIDNCEGLVKLRDVITAYLEALPCDESLIKKLEEQRNPNLSTKEARYGLMCALLCVSTSSAIIKKVRGDGN